MIKFCKFCNFEHENWYKRPNDGKLECRSRRAFHAKKHHVENVEETKEYKKNWQKENAEHLASYLQDWRQGPAWAEYKPIKNKKQSERDKIRKQVDLNYKLAKILRTRLYCAIKGGHRGGSAVRDLGCSIDELINYFETKFKLGMSWSNHGKWHIDHIIPLAAFDLSDPIQLRIACNYKNLQPLWAEENLKKGDNV